MGRRMTKPVGDAPRAAVATDRRALHPYIKAQQNTDREMIKVLKSAQREVERALAKSLAGRQGIGAQVRQDQFRAARSAILREQADMWRKLGKTVVAGRYDAAAAAADSMHIYDRMLFSAVGQGRTADMLLEGMKQFAKSAIDLGQTRLVASRIELSHNVYRTQALSNGLVDRLVQDMITRGTSARELASAVGRFVNPDTPGGASYAAMRLGRTELNNAFHASQVLIADKEPWVDKVQWNLSSSHPKPDKCDDYAHHKLYDPRDVPPKPHPQCLCFVTPETVPVDDFIASLTAGKYDNYIKTMS